MEERHFATVDGNEAAARVAHLTNEVIAIYPITPASPMGELADAWSNAGRANLFGVVPEVVEMQSEGGAAGAVHGSLQTGALTTTFTASQGLLLMIPNMFKIAGELTPMVLHVAARTVATHALSIFGDHSDVMAARTTGFGMLCAGSVQEAQDFALIAQAASLSSRVPFVHFFDGFRTSHEVNRIELLSEEEIRALIDLEAVRAHRERALDPNRPVLRGTAQNPDVFFQAREAVNPFYARTPALVQEAMDRFRHETGRAYRLFDYHGAPDAERVLVLMGSGTGAAAEAVDALVSRGERVGMVAVRLYRPFDVAAFAAALPETVKGVAVLDRTKEPGAPGEPLYQDVTAALAEAWPGGRPRPDVIGGRYGLSSKEFTPAMAAAVLAEAGRAEPRRHFTVGIRDDVGHTSLEPDPDFHVDRGEVKSAVFYGLGSDGTVGANKSTVKIIGEHTSRWAQGYFVYDSKKAGSVTVSHLRFGPEPIRSTYLVQEADFVACHQFQFLGRIDVLETARPGATFLLNSSYGPDEVWEHLPLEVQRAILEKELCFHVVDGYGVAREAGLGRRINTVMQTCFFALSGTLPMDEALPLVKESIREVYGRRGESVVRRNLEAVDAALAAMHEVPVADREAGGTPRQPSVPAAAPDFVQRVTQLILAGKGDLLPVSALPVDGTFPVGTARYEKRSIAQEIPIWEPDICISCALCAFICPHAAIRMKVFPESALAGGPEGFESLPWKGKEYADGADRITIQVAPDDCTGCGVCVEVCPARSKEVARRKAINMEPKTGHLERERERFSFFLGLPEADRKEVRLDSVKGCQMLEPLFEFSGACAGCGETPYLKLLTQLFGDRMLVANATGCSSIYGGNLPTTPWSADASGRGPAWSNSLFEDNAEFGLGMRLALDRLEDRARGLLGQLADAVGPDLAAGLAGRVPASDEAALAERRERISELRRRLEDVDDPRARDLAVLADHLARTDVWIVGGDGWAYDIGFGGLDHVLASGRDVNVLVLDTEVYSNTGGQASKATFRAATAKFAAGGKSVPKKDLGMIAMAYGNVYVAQIAMGAQPQQTIRALLEAARHPGPSLVIAYSPCIAHGIDMRAMAEHQKLAVTTGYWPLYRHDPAAGHDGGHPFRLDSRRPRSPFRTFAEKEARFAMLMRADPDRAEELFSLAQRDIDARWDWYDKLSGLERTVADAAGDRS